MEYGKQATSNGIGAGFIAPPTPDNSKIRDEITQGEQILSELHATIEQLERRLDTALTPVPPQPAGLDARNVQSSVKSHLLGRVQMLNEGFAHAITRLNDIRTRIEL